MGKRSAMAPPAFCKRIVPNPVHALTTDNPTVAMAGFTRLRTTLRLSIASKVVEIAFNSTSVTIAIKGESVRA